MDNNNNDNVSVNDNQYCCCLCKGIGIGQLFKINNDNNDYIHIYCALYSTNVWIKLPSLLLDNNNNNDNNNDDIYKLPILNCHANSIFNYNNTNNNTNNNNNILPNYFMNINETIIKSKTIKCCSLGCNNKVLIDRAFICNNHQSWKKDNDWKSIASYIHDNHQLKSNSLSIDIDLFPLHLRRILMTILELEIYDINIITNLPNSIDNINNDNDDIILTDVYNLKRTFNKADIISWNWKYLSTLENNQVVVGQCDKYENSIDCNTLISTEKINRQIISLNKDHKQGKIYNKTKKLFVEKDMYCTVCGEISLNQSDCILQCIDCNVHVHKSCVQNSYYEICGFEIDSTSFKCISCVKKNDKKCCLCMCDDDNSLYMLPTTKGCFFWAHCLCIYAHQESKLILCSKKQSCVICKASDIQGANNFQLMKCGEETCKNLFHPTCAYIEGYEFSSSRIVRRDLVDGILVDPIELKVFCQDCMSKRNVSLRKRVIASSLDEEIVSSSDDEEALLENEDDHFTNWDGTIRHMIGNIEISSDIEMKRGDDTIMTVLGTMKGLINWEKAIYHRTFLHEEVLKAINKYGSNDNIVVMNLSNFDNSLQECLKGAFALLTTTVPNYKYFLMALEHNLQDISILSSDFFKGSKSKVYMIGIRPYKEDNLLDVFNERQNVINERQKPSQIQPKEKTSKTNLKQKFPIEYEEQVHKDSKDSKDSPKKIPDRSNIEVMKTSPRKSELSPSNSARSNSMTQYVRSLLEKPNVEPVSTEIVENLTPLNEDDQPYDISIFENEPEYNASESINTEAILDIAIIRTAFYAYLSSLPQTKCSVTLAKDWFKRKQGSAYDGKVSLKKLLDIDDKISKDGRFIYKNNVFVDNQCVEGYITIADKNVPSDIKKQSEINRDKQYSTSAPITDIKTERIQNTTNSDPKNNERYRSTSSSTSSSVAMNNNIKDTSVNREKRDQNSITSYKKDRNYERDFERDIERGPSRSHERSRQSNDDYDDKRQRRSRSRDRHDHYDDRRDRYDDRRDRYDDRRDRYDDRRDRYDDYDERRSRRSFSRERDEQSRSRERDYEQSRSRERDYEHKQKARKKNDNIFDAPCKYFLTSKGCQRENCKFLHIRDRDNDTAHRRDKVSSNKTVDESAVSQSNTTTITSKPQNLESTRLGLLAKKGLSNLPAWMTKNESK